MECALCAHRFADYRADPDHVADIYADSYFTDGGAGYEDYAAGQAELLAQGHYYGRLLARHSRVGHILDVGAAAGFILDGFRQSGWTPHGIEPNATMARYARDQLRLPVEVGTLEDYETDVRFRAVALIQVLGHFVEPVRALTKAVDFLEPGGLILVETWDSRSVFARACGSHWHEYSPPSVLHYFSRASAMRCMRELGLEFVATGRRHKPLRVDHARSLVEHTYGEGSLLATAMKALPGRLAIPYLPDDLFWGIWRRPGRVH